MKNTRTGSALIIFLALFGVFVIAGLTYYALMPKSEVADESQFVQVDAGPRIPASGYKRVEFEKLSFEVPNSWEDTSRNLDTVIKEYSYTDPTSGDYIEVRVGGGGSSIGSDTSWKYVTLSGSTGYIQLQEEGADCVDNGEPFCQIGDGRLDIYANIDTGEQIGVIDGQLYSIFIGNTKSESVDRQLYRDILATGYVAQ